MNLIPDSGTPESGRLPPLGYLARPRRRPNGQCPPAVRHVKLPPLDALIVHVAGARKGHPGSGYFRANNLPDPFAAITKDDLVAALGEKPTAVSRP